MVCYITVKPKCVIVMLVLFENFTSQISDQPATNNYIILLCIRMKVKVRPIQN